MTINYHHLYKQGLTDSDFLLLTKIFSKDVSLITTELDGKQERLDKLEQMQLIQYRAGKKTIENLRMSKAGDQLLKQLRVGEYSDEVGFIVDRAMEEYKNYGKPTGRYKEIVSRMTWFVSETKFRSDLIINCIIEHLSSSGQYTMSLDNLIWKPANLYSTNFSLEGSKLYDIICVKMGLDTNLLSSSGNTVYEYLLSVSKLRIPAKLPSEYSLTGSVKGDKERLKELFYSFCEMVKEGKNTDFETLRRQIDEVDYFGG